MAIDSAKTILISLVAAHHADFGQPMFEPPGDHFCQERPSGRTVVERSASMQ